MYNIELKDNFTRHTYLTSDQKQIYLLDKNVDRDSGTRPKNYFMPLTQKLPQDTIDEDILEYAVKNNYIIITNDKLFVVKNLLKSKNVIYQDNYGIRHYFSIKESFVFDTVNYFAEDSIQKNPNIFSKIKNLMNDKKITPSYILSFNSENFEHNKSSDLFVRARDVLPKSIRKIHPKLQPRKILKYATENNLTIVTRDPYFCILSLLRMKRCIFEDEDGTRYSILLDDSFEFERVTEFKQEPKPDISKSDVLEYNISNIKNSIDYIMNNLDYVERELRLRNNIENNIVMNRD